MLKYSAVPYLGDTPPVPDYGPLLSCRATALSCTSDPPLSREESCGPQLCPHPVLGAERLKAAPTPTPLLHALVP